MKNIFKLFTMSLCSMGILLTLSLTLNAKFVPCDKMIHSFTPVVTEDINGVASINTSTIKTYNRGEIKDTKLEDHDTYWIEPYQSTASATSDVRLVTYSSGTSNMWQGKKPSELAKIYEKENPGWIVIGGINGDFFYIGDNCEPLNTHMQEGDFYKPYDWNSQGHGSLGFRNDGTTIFGRPDISWDEKFQVLNEQTGKYENIGSFQHIDYMDKNSNGLHLLTRFAVTKSKNAIFHESQDLPYDLTDWTVLTIKYDVERYDRSTQHVFVKGEVVNRTTGQKTYRIEDSEQYSYVAYKNGELDSVEIGAKVRCQNELQNEWKDVNNMVGYYNHILDNGKVVQWTKESDVNQDYVNPVKNRTVMGFKKDGTPIMMVVDKKNSYGASYEECGTLLKSLGCVDGFLFDGGGSSSIFKRDIYGDFVTLNACQDGNERKDDNAILMVMRDPGFKIETSEETFTSAKVKVEATNKEYFDKLSNLQVVIGDRKIPYQEGGVVINGLEDGSVNNVSISYDIPSYKDDSKVVTAKVNNTIRTYEMKLDFDILNVSKTSVTVSLPKGNGSELVKGAKATINGVDYEPNEEGVIVCGDLEGSTTYKIDLTYLVDAGNGVEYYVTLPEKEFTTLSYEAPTIEEFKEKSKTDTSVRFEYKYIDYDGVVTNAYIVYGDEKIALNSKSGKQLISHLDFNNNSYEFKLVLECEADGKEFTIESESIKYTATAPIEPEAPAKKGCNCKKSQGELLVSLLAAVSLLGVAIKRFR